MRFASINKFALLISVIMLSGCSAFQDRVKESVGNYVTDAALQAVQAKLELKLSERDVSLAEIKSLFLADKDGRVTPEAALQNAKDFAKDYALMVVERYQAKVESKIEEVAGRYAQKSEQEMKEIKKELDQNDDGAISKEEVQEILKSKLAEFGSGMKDDTKEMATRLFNDVKSGAITKEQLQQELSAYTDGIKEKVQELWRWLLGAIATLVSSYLGKQVISGKSDAKRDAKIAVLEKLFGRDLNANGVIGNGASKTIEG